MSLAPSPWVINQLTQKTGMTFASSDFAFAASATTITPTLHFGGSGYFFKLELPCSISSDFFSFGLGLYPINVGYLVHAWSIFPYVSLGGAANAMLSRESPDPTTSHKLVGGVLQARSAIGVKYFPIPGLALSTEVGYSPWTIGLVAVQSGAVAGSASSVSTNMRGGMGTVLDFSFGVEWL